MAVMTLDHYAREHEAARRDWTDAPSWLARLRQDALDRFLALGFPTTRDEEWRFTSVAPIAGVPFRLGAPTSSVVAGGLQASGPAGRQASGPAGRQASGPAGRQASGSAIEVVFVDGRYAPDRSTMGEASRGVVVDSLAAALVSRSDEIEPHLARLATVNGRAFTALNTAFMSDGVYVRVPAHVVLEAPIHVRFVSTAAAAADTITHPRILVVAGEHSQVTVVERYEGEGGRRYFTNAVTEVALGQRAVVDHYKLQQESVEAFHVGAIHVHAERQASFSSHSVSLGGVLVRNDVSAVLDGEGAHCTLNGVYLAGGRRLVDNHTTIDHAKPHCDSREIYKGILSEHARGVFNGKIIVRPDAQKTDAKQTNRALLLSEDAQINTKPQLEIFANDVKCTHGAAVGQLDEEAVFYLRARGLGEADARRLLIQAFVGDVITLMPLVSIRAGVEAALLRELALALPAAAA